MRNAKLQELLNQTPADVKRYVELYAAIADRVHDIMQRKGITQRQLAEKMDKSPSEISKWLSGEHNFTLRSIAKLETELGEPILAVQGAQQAATTQFTCSETSHLVSLSGWVEMANASKKRHRRKVESACIPGTLPA